MSHKVLIIEDNPDDAFIFGRLLKMEGHSFEIATNGPEGLRRALSGEFDVVLTDYSLGDVTGADLAERLADGPSPPFVVLVTGYATQIDDPSLLSRGVNAVLPKPCRGDDLREVLSRVSRER